MSFDPAYAERLDKLIRGADTCGLAVIVSYFYGAQTRHLRDGKAVRNAVTTASEFLRAGGYTNVIVEIANELNISNWRQGGWQTSADDREWKAVIYLRNGETIERTRDLRGL